MLVVRYSNGNKIKDSTPPQIILPVAPPIVNSPAPRQTKTLSQPAPPSAAPTKGCGCGR